MVFDVVVNCVGYIRNVFDILAEQYALYIFAEICLKKNIEQ